MIRRLSIMVLVMLAHHIDNVCRFGRRQAEEPDDFNEVGWMKFYVHTSIDELEEQDDSPGADDAPVAPNWLGITAPTTQMSWQEAINYKEEN